MKVLVKCSPHSVLPDVVQEMDSPDIFSNVKSFAPLLTFLEVDASLVILVEIGECIAPPTNWRELRLLLLILPKKREERGWSRGPLQQLSMLPGRCLRGKLLCCLDDEQQEEGGLGRRVQHQWGFRYLN